jgi:hypothetical protein
MSPLRRFWNLLRRSRIDDDLRQELATHLSDACQRHWWQHAERRASVYRTESERIQRSNAYA